MTAAKGTLVDFLAVTVAGKAPALDFYPSAASPLKDALEASQCAADDFNGTKRPQGKSCDAGAYEATTATNPGWGLKEGFKDGSSSGSGIRGAAPRARPAPGKTRPKAAQRLGAMLFAPGGDEALAVRSDGRRNPPPAVR